MRLEKLLLRGAVLGFLLPAFSFMAYAYIRSDGDFLALYYQLEVLGVHTQVMSLCVLVNIVPFLIFIRAKRKTCPRNPTNNHSFCASDSTG